MSHFLVERYMPADAGARLSDLAAGLAETGDDAALLMTIYSPSDETCFHLFAAGSLIQVQEIGRAAGVVMDRIVPVIAVENKGVPDVQLEPH